MKIQSKLFFCLWLLPLLVSCQSATPWPADWLVTQSDKTTYSNSPSPEGLIFPSKVSLFLIRDQSPMISDDIAEQIKAELQKTFAEESGMIFISEDRIQYQLHLQTTNSQRASNRFNPQNKLQSFQLAQNLKADSIGFLDIQEAPSQEDSTKAVKGKITLEIYQSKSTELIFSQNLSFDSQKIKKTIQKAKPSIQAAFPLEGFILTTRENHQFAKISLGRSRGIKVGRKFSIHKRSITLVELDGKPQKSVLLSPIVQAIGTVIYLDENEAWIEIKKKGRRRILQGMSVKSLPEKNSLLW